MRVISSFELYTFNMILLLGVALSIVDLCAGSRRSLMDSQPLSTSVNGTAAKYCDIPLHNLDYVKVSPCKAPCILELGKTYSMKISFSTDRRVHNGSFSFDLKHGLLWERWLTSKGYLCEGLYGAICPLYAGQHAVFSMPKFTLTKTHNHMKVKRTPMRFVMTDTRGELLFCFILTVEFPWKD